MAITLRNTKGTALTYTELDANFTDLDTRIDAIDQDYIRARETPFDTEFNVKTTDDLTEGTYNKYFLKENFDSDLAAGIAGISTDSVGEGSSNLYYTQGRFDTAFTAKTTADLSEDSTNKYYTKARVDSDIGEQIAGTNTNALSEGSNNLYYTTLRHDSDFNVIFAVRTTDSLSEGTANLYYTTARHDSDFGVRFGNATTDSLGEGSTNFYYTQSRVDSDIADKTKITLTYGSTLDSAGTGLNPTFGGDLILKDNSIKHMFTLYVSTGPAYYFNDSGGKFFADQSLSGIVRPKLYLRRGESYIFRQLSWGGNEFCIYEDSDDAGGYTRSKYADGVQNWGNSDGTHDVVFTPKMNAPTKLTYNKKGTGFNFGKIVIV